MVEAEQHINCLEIKTAILAFKAFLRVESRNAATIPESGPPTLISYPSANGQYTCCDLREPEGRHLVNIVVPSGFGIVVLPADPRFMDDCPSLSRSV